MHINLKRTWRSMRAEMVQFPMMPRWRSFFAFSSFVCLSAEKTSKHWPTWCCRGERRDGRVCRTSCDRGHGWRLRGDDDKRLPLRRMTFFIRQLAATTSKVQHEKHWGALLRNLDGNLNGRLIWVFVLWNHFKISVDEHEIYKVCLSSPTKSKPSTLHLCVYPLFVFFTGFQW